MATTVVEYPALYDLKPKVLGDTIMPLRIKMRIKDSDPVEYYDLRGYKFWFTAKKHLRDDYEEAKIKVVVEISADLPDPVYEAVISFEGVDTGILAEKDEILVLEYDVQCQKGNSFIFTPMRGLLTLEYHVTEVRDYLA